MAALRIDTDRLILRRWTQADHAPFAAMCADPDVMRYIGNGTTRTAAQSSRAIERFENAWDERGFGLFAVETKETGRFIGFAGLSSPEFLPEILPSVEIGWRFAKASWGQGYASEAAAAALAHAVNYLSLTDIVSIYQIGNIASQRIMQTLGFVFDRKTVDPSCDREVAVYRLPPQCP